MQLVETPETEAGAVSGNTGGRRRSDGAGARNRTEIGGYGGNANKTVFGDDSTRPHFYGVLDSGDYGKDGESCGIVKIKNDIKVYTYGGAGRRFGFDWK